MKLYYSPTSPYVRKVTMMALETGLDDKISTLQVMAGPAGDVAKANPLGKIPALELDDGQVLFDSAVICEYLDSLHSGEKMIPQSGAKRWTALQLQALADGAMDAGILRFMESKRPEDERSATWVERQNLAFNQALDAMDAAVGSFSKPIDLVQITFCVALGWFDFRLSGDGDWRTDRPALADWYVNFSARPSAMASEPKAPA